MSDEAPTNAEIIAALRAFQDGAQRIDAMPFDEWRMNGGLKRDALAKQKSGMAHLNAGTGMMGHANTSSRAPAGTRNRASGEQAVGWNGKQNPSPEKWFDNQQFGVQAGQAGTQQSQYLTQRLDQPPPWIDDVDMASVWYSPMEPVWPFGPPFYTRPREWDFPVGYNLNYVQPRIQQMNLLRGMRQGWGVLSTIIETRKDQLLRLPWTIQLKDKPRGASKAAADLRKFFKRPDGKLTYSQWAHKLMDDLFVLDAPTLYINRNMAGQPHSVEVLDGATIFPLIDDAGRRPDTSYDIGDDGIIYYHRQPAFQQIIYGLPMLNLSEDEIIYAMMRPRPEMPVFGYSPVEQIFSEVTEAIRKTFYQLEFWRSGSMPELIVTVPDNWTPNQIASFQGHFDATLSGQLSLKSKVRFVPGGMKPFDIKNANGQSLWSDRDELLVRLACYAFSVSPTAFVKQTNRGTASSAQQSAQEEGLYPLMSWWKDDIMDNIIQEKFGCDDIEFVFLPRPEVDQEKQAKIHQVQLQYAIRTINEVRAELGEEPVEQGNDLLVYTGAGAIKLSSILDGTALVPGAPPPQAAGNEEKPQTAAQKDTVPMRGPARPHGSSTLPPTTAHSADVVKAIVTHKDVKQAAQEAEPSPSHEQKHTGNYKKGHIYIQGLNITIENAKGSLRNGKDKNGEKWKVKMPAPYGYIRGFLGADSEHMDVYIGKHPESTLVYVVDQNEVDPEGKVKHFDEHKCLIGFYSPRKASQTWLKSHMNNEGLDRFSAITVLEMSEFKRWLHDGDMKTPISTQNIGVVLGQKGKEGGITKNAGAAATISTSTGLDWYDQSLPGVKNPKRKKRKQGNSRKSTLG